MDTFEIYSYYDTSVYAKVLTAVGSFFADSSFIDLIQRERSKFCVSLVS